MSKATGKPRNNNAKRAQTLGADAIQNQCRKASRNSPWRKQAACQTKRAQESRERLSAMDNAVAFDPDVDVDKVPF